MLRVRARVLATVLLPLLACNAPKVIEPERVALEPSPVPTALHAAEPAVTSPHGAPDPRLPIVGDPLGLLSRPREGARSATGKAAKASANAVDPGALMAARATSGSTPSNERDPRAVARGRSAMAETARPAATIPSQLASGPVHVQEKSAAEVVNGIRKGAARPHVLLLYASYCRPCRNALPEFLKLVQSYQRRGVLFTAASVDRDASAYESYAPALGGVLPAVLIRSEGSMRNELVRAGLSIPGDSFGIPLIAVFDARHRLVRQGGSAEIAQLPQTLDGLRN